MEINTWCLYKNTLAVGQLFQDAQGLTVRIEEIEVEDGRVHFEVITDEPDSEMHGVMSANLFEERFTTKLGKPVFRNAA